MTDHPPPAGVAVDWQSYRQLCDRPDVCSRWMLERTIDLLADDPAAGALRRVLLSAPLAKPADHRGPPATDMFIAALEPGVVAAVLVAVSRRAADNELAGLLNGRSPAGFEAAWREFAAHRQATGLMAMQTGCNGGGLDDDTTDRRE